MAAVKDNALRNRIEKALAAGEQLRWVGESSGQSPITTPLEPLLRIFRRRRIYAITDRRAIAFNGKNMDVMNSLEWSETKNVIVTRTSSNTGTILISSAMDEDGQSAKSIEFANITDVDYVYDVIKRIRTGLG